MDEQQIRNLYEAFGLAMYQAQCIERQLAILLVSLQEKSPQNRTTLELEALYTRAFQRTLGQLLDLVRREASIPAEMETRLTEALSTRNHLAHNYFWDRAGEVQTVTGRQFMIQELREIATRFDQLDEELTALMQGWTEQFGITQAVLESAMQRLKEDSMNR
ncbi:MAG: hypothetical protein K2Y39_14405 [Candidatus Obscuribacterales bacterium]|nr:hypothetical protein [Candidatus Obscuribacterales bacterium]